MQLDHTQIIVLGAGRSGLAAARLAAARGARVTLLDSAPEERFASQAPVPEGPVTTVFGEAALRYDGEADLVVTSPGIDPGAPIVRQFAERGMTPIGEIEFASRFWRGTVIGITGTNGKTTTTELTAHLLREAGVPATPAGNVGKPFAEVIVEGEESGTVVLELSSFQLETVDTFHADVGVWLNFAPDHMDRYTCVEDYRDAKRALFRTQTTGDWAVINALNGPDIPLTAQTLTFSAFGGKADFTFDNGEILFRRERVVALADTLLSGKHNAENLMAALAVGHARGIPFDRLRTGISSYQPPRHRCETVGRRGGVVFINDSKATNVHALESSLRALDGEIILIAGGKEKGLDYGSLSAYLGKNVVRLIAIGEIRHRLCALAEGLTPCEAVASLEEAVAKAGAQAAPGQTVLFSPGTSSFDMFANYEERGDAFRQLVHQQHLQHHD